MSKNNTKRKTPVDPVEQVVPHVPTLAERVDDEILAEYGELDGNVSLLLSAILRELVRPRVAKAWANIISRG